MVPDGVAAVIVTAVILAGVTATILAAGPPRFAAAQPAGVLADGGLADGELCSDGRPANPAGADALCQSGRCLPGPSVRARSPGWYCVAREMACALPGKEGAATDTLVTIEGTRYQCLDPGTGGPHRFAPIR